MEGRKRYETEQDAIDRVRELNAAPHKGRYYYRVLDICGTCEVVYRLGKRLYGEMEEGDFRPFPNAWEG